MALSGGYRGENGTAQSRMLGASYLASQRVLATYGSRLLLSLIRGYGNQFKYEVDSSIVGWVEWNGTHHPKRTTERWVSLRCTHSTHSNRWWPNASP